MKKILLRSLLVVVILIILAVVAVGFFMDDAVKKGIETFGPKLAKVEIKLDKVGISLLSGSGKVSGLTIGNPAGFKTAHAISIGSATLALTPGSLLSDKIVIKKIEVMSPEITFEGGLNGNNLSQIVANLNEGAGSGGTPAPGQSTPAKPAKKLQVDEFTITGAKLHISVSGLMGSSAVPVPLPDIHLTDLGSGPEGITAADLVKKVISEIEKDSAKAVANAATGLGKGATDAASKLGKGIGDLFKK